MTQSLLQELIKRFDQEEVMYCHWKSNVDLAKTLEGELDIDLLVSNNSFATATVILMQLGFKPAASRWIPNPSGIFHYYGYDPRLNDLVHIHLFVRVLTGESFLKSHMLPFAEMLLGNTISTNGLTVTSKDTELILFVLRMYIKYGSFLDVPRLLRSDKKLREEANWLKEGSDMDRIVLLLEKYCPVVSEDIFNKSLNAILHGAPYLKKWILAFQIRRRLRIYRKYSFLDWFFGHLQFLTGNLVKKIRKQKGSKILISGGTVIAIVGADATGKSTLVSKTSQWLRRNFIVNTIHAGKPPLTLLTVPINFGLALYRRIKKGSKSVRRLDKSPSSKTGVVYAEGFSLNTLIFAFRAVCLAYERRSLLLKIRRFIANGEIVVCDRYPSNEIGAMDSPRLREDVTQRGFVVSIYNWLARVERTLYRQIPPPDIVLRLSVSLETAKMRNASRNAVDDDLYLESRHKQEKDLFCSGTRSTQEIDTDPPLCDTFLAVKKAIWSSL